jgi:hypothetical protein
LDRTAYSVIGCGPPSTKSTAILIEGSFAGRDGYL